MRGGLQQQINKYVVVGKKIGIRCGPSIVGDARDAGYLISKEVFEVDKITAGEDGRQYLRLADGSGWVYDRSSKDFNKVVVQELPVIAPVVPNFEGKDGVSTKITCCLSRLVPTPSCSQGSSSLVSPGSRAGTSQGLGRRLLKLAQERRPSSKIPGGSNVSRPWLLQEWAALKKQHGLKAWELVFDNAKRRMGVCRQRKKLIGISIHFMEDPATTRQQVKNTLLHEIAHALVGNEHHHDAVWKAKAISIGCDGHRCGRWEQTNIEKPFQLRCEKGCWSVARLRKAPLSGKCRCKKCGAGLEYAQIVAGKFKKVTSSVVRFKFEKRCKRGCWVRPCKTPSAAQREAFLKRKCKKCGEGVEYRAAKDVK